VERGGEREVGQTRRLGPVIPQPVGTDQHDPAPGRLEPRDVRLRPGHVGAEPAGYHVGLRRGQGLGLGHLALRDQFLGQRVVSGQPFGLGVGGQPVGAAVTEPADRDRIRADDRGDVRGRRRAPRRAQDGHGLVSLAHARQGRLVGVVAAPDRREQHPDGGLRPGQRRVVRVRRGRHPVADHDDRYRACRRFRGRQSHRVLVARMPQPAVGDPGQQLKVELDVVAA
jgi:hypothetical protein